MKQLYLKDRIWDFERLGIRLYETLWSSHQVEVDVASRHARQISDVCMMMIRTF